MLLQATAEELSVLTLPATFPFVFRDVQSPDLVYCCRGWEDETRLSRVAGCRHAYLCCKGLHCTDFTVAKPRAEYAVSGQRDKDKMCACHTCATNSVEFKRGNKTKSDKTAHRENKQQMLFRNCCTECSYFTKGEVVSLLLTICFR